MLSMKLIKVSKESFIFVGISRKLKPISQIYDITDATCKFYKNYGQIQTKVKSYQ